MKKIIGVTLLLGVVAGVSLNAFGPVLQKAGKAQDASVSRQKLTKDQAHMLLNNEELLNSLAKECGVSLEGQVGGYVRRLLENKATGSHLRDIDTPDRKRARKRAREALGCFAEKLGDIRKDIERKVIPY